MSSCYIRRLDAGGGEDKERRKRKRGKGRIEGRGGMDNGEHGEVTIKYEVSDTCVRNFLLR